MGEAERRQSRLFFCTLALLACFLSKDLKGLPLNSLRLVDMLLSWGLQCSVDRELDSLISHVNLGSSLKLSVPVLNL